MIDILAAALDFVLTRATLPAQTARSSCRPFLRQATKTEVMDA
jgi:hypothetical protein